MGEEFTRVYTIEEGYRVDSTDIMLVRNREEGGRLAELCDSSEVWDVKTRQNNSVGLQRTCYEGKNV